MPKVVTGKGFDDFVLKGEHQTIDGADKGPISTPLMEVKKDVIIDVSPGPKAEAQEEPEETGLEAEDQDLAERAQKRIAKKHREMKQADALAKKLRSELDESEDFSKAQYRRAQLAEERSSELERELNDLRAKAPPVVPAPGLARPIPENFYDEKGQFKAFEYAEKLSEYSAKKAVEDDRKQQTEERTKAEQAQISKAFEGRLEKARGKYPDFKEVVGNSDLIVPPYIQQYMVESDFGGDIGYYFAKNPEAFERISKLSPIKAIAEIGKLEVQWESKAPAEKPAAIVPAKPSAPAPMTPLTGSGSPGVNSDPAKMSPKELLAYTRERAIAKKRGR